MVVITMTIVAVTTMYQILAVTTEIMAVIVNRVFLDRWLHKDLQEKQVRQVQ